MGCGGSNSRVTPGDPATDTEPSTQAHGLTAGSGAIHEEPPAEPARYEQHEQQDIVQARARANDPRWDVKAFETLVEHDTPFVSAGYLRQLRGKALVNAELSHHRVPSSELHHKLPGGVGIVGAQLFAVLSAWLMKEHDDPATELDAIVAVVKHSGLQIHALAHLLH